MPAGWLGYRCCCERRWLQTWQWLGLEHADLKVVALPLSSGKELTIMWLTLVLVNPRSEILQQWAFPGKSEPWPSMEWSVIKQSEQMLSKKAVSWCIGSSTFADANPTLWLMKWRYSRPCCTRSVRVDPKMAPWVGSDQHTAVTFSSAWFLGPVVETQLKKYVMKWLPPSKSYLNCQGEHYQDFSHSRSPVHDEPWFT